ncbi:MAG: Methyl-accepting chemotaxis protein PctA [Planctomycetota bacterium]|jgi:methyl-accepting chemotaxis protein WspA
MLVLLFVALAPIGTLLFILKGQVDQTVERSALATISAIAEGKAAQLDALGRERVRQVAAVENAVAFLEAVESLSATYRPDGTRDEAAMEAARERFRPRWEGWTRTNDVDLLLLADRNGRIVFSSGESPLLHRELLASGGAPLPLARALAKVRSTKTPALTRPELAADGGRPQTEIVGPLLRGGELVGFVIVPINPADIDKIVTDYTGLGTTGETVCATMLAGDMVLTTPTRADPAAAYTMHAPLGSDFAKNLQGSVYGSPSRGRGTDTTGAPALGAWTRVESLGWAIGVTKQLDEVFASAAEQQRAILSIAAIAVLPVIVIALIVARSIARPIGDAADASRRIADGDLSGDIRVIGSGEPRALLVTMRDAMRSLVGLLHRVKESGASLGATAHALRATAHEQDEIARSFGESSAQIAAAVREITATQHELNHSMQIVANALREAAGSASDGRLALARLSDEIDTLRTGAESISTRLDAIRVSAERITGVVASMAKVANQTNLLSVNAAMEAERAGEAGAGFRAVAVEIRRLSAQTADATLAIEGIVREMQVAVAAGVEDMSRYTTSVQSGTANVASLGSQLGTVIGGVEHLGKEVDLVARGVEAQALGVAQVSHALTSLSEGAARTASAATRFIETSQELERRADGFVQEVGAFRLPAST